MSKSQARIVPRTLKGFRDYLPRVMIPRERIMEQARQVYRSYGFSPIDTPALEYLEILTGKGGEESDKQMFKFERKDDQWVGMRFDLTVPLARFVAQHAAELGMPFKRYHIATVWRGENTQRGRYREFMQCDFDTIGTLSPAADCETALVIHDLLRAIGFSEFQIHVNDRRLLTGLLTRLDLADQAALVLRALDKLKKIGAAGVIAEMTQCTRATPEQAQTVVQLAQTTGTNAQILAALEPLVADSETGKAGLEGLRHLLTAVTAAGVDEKQLVLDVSIARGLDYYTGTVFETFLGALPEIGSICSGGRYDNLAGLYTHQELPGIGASLGLDRLLAAMEELQMLEGRSTLADVLVPFFDAGRLTDYLRLAAGLRKAGLRVEVYPEPQRLGKQLKYADRQGFRAAVIVGGDEFAQNVCQIKDLKAGSSETVSMANDLALVKERLQALLAAPAA